MILGGVFGEFSTITAQFRISGVFMQPKLSTEENTSVFLDLCCNI